MARALPRGTRRRRIRCFAAVDRGLVRASNQDAAFARWRDGAAVLAVADGMGGLPAGERASALVIAAFEGWPRPDEAAEGWLRDGLERARVAVAADVAAHPERARMGSTVVVAVVRDGHAWIAHAGDSRAYRWRGSALEPLTQDHSLAGEAVRAGLLDASVARHSPGRHMLTRAIGAPDSTADFAGPLALDADAVLLLVTDGVSGVLDEREIASAVATRRGAAIARALIERVHAAGAPDNAGIALLDCRE
ncbi:MAG: serine/threonine-protein phosphatase [Dehalococcoidia bacterium]|nr:serine/threonine-protein phosphatase [Dehalococcoidia bacterium]